MMADRHVTCMNSTVARTLVPRPPNPLNRPTEETWRLPCAAEAARGLSDRAMSSTSELQQGRRRSYAPAAAHKRRAAPPRDVASRPPRSWRRSVPRSAVGGSSSSAGAASVMRRRAKRTPASASSHGRLAGRSRHCRLGGRASDSPAAAHQSAGSGEARPRPRGRVPANARE